MKTAVLCFAVSLLASCCSVASAQEKQMKTLVFEDAFERSESDEAIEEIGNGWESNSHSRAGGNKQVDLKEGAMHVRIHESADHGVSLAHDAAFRDGLVEVRFMLEHEKDSLGLNFADRKYKEVHAGHLFKVTIGVKSIQISDLKTGVMDKKIRELRKAGRLSARQKEMLKTKTARLPNQLETGKYYLATVKVEGDTAAVSIDETKVGSFASEGIAHPTKRTLRLAVNRNAIVDDVKVYSMAK